MRKTSQSLPRHTNLASQGLRFVATIVDIAIGLAITLVFYFACFNLILSNTTNELRETMDTYRLESHLQIKREDGSVGIVENTVESYESALQGYYLRYLTGKPLEGEGIAPNSNKTIVVDNVEVLPKDLYTVSYYNKNVLGITQDNPDGEQSASYFTYQKDENGNFLKDELAIKRDHYYDADLGHQVELTDTLFLAKYQEIYVTAYYHLVNQEFFTVISNDYYFFYTLGIVASIAIAGIINYIVIPFFMKNGQTIGKKIFKLGLASYDGYKFSNFQLLLRIVPFLLVDGALLLPIWSNIF